MKHVNINELPEDYRNLYANKIYFEIINEKISYDKKTIDDIVDYFITTEDYMKCKNLKDIINELFN